MGFLRLILALAVVIYHTRGSIFGFTIMDGFVAVHIFFIISGFYMALIIKNKYSKSPKPYYSFISNRLLRIFPVYWVILLLMIYVQYSGISNNIFATIQNYFYQKGLIGVIEDFSLIIRKDYFDLNMFQKDPLTVAPAWSLVLELIFYFAAPFLIRLKKSYLVIIAFMSFLIHFLITHGVFPGTYVRSFFVPANFYFFIVGIFSYYLYEKIKDRKIKFSRVISFTYLFFILLWGCVPEFRIGWILVKEWLAYLLTPIVIPLFFYSLKKLPGDTFMANLSYAVYISHMLAVNFLVIILNINYDTQYFTLWSVTATLIISLATAYLVEKPLDKIRQKRIKIFPKGLSLT